jgi:hypothetical protein
MKKIYRTLKVTASDPETKIWISDDRGFLVVSEYSEINEGLLPGKYRIRFGLENKVDFEIDLQADTELTEANVRDFTREIVNATATGEV